jgi:hypothetical protein
MKQRIIKFPHRKIIIHTKRISMKTSIKNFVLSTLILAFLSFASCSTAKKTAATKSPAPAPAKTEVKAALPAYAGTWAFLVKGTPDGDTSGDMIISQEGSVIKGVMSTAVGKTDIQDLVISNNALKGVFYYNGTSVNISGNFNGNSFEGKCEAEGYTFPITATKK